MIINNKQMIANGWKRYGLIKKWRRFLGPTLIASSFILPDLGIGIIIGMVILKIDPRLKFKVLKQDIKERWLLL